MGLRAWAMGAQAWRRSGAEPPLPRLDEHAAVLLRGALTGDEAEALTARVQAARERWTPDFDGEQFALRAREREARLAVDAPLRGRFDAFWLAYRADGTQDDATWLSLRRELKDRGVAMPRYVGQFSQRQLLNALYSAREGRPIGFGFGTFIEVAHWIASSHKGYLRAFRQALEAYGRAEQLKAEDHTGKWRDKVSLYKPKLQANDPAYASINPYPELTSFLFPELR